MKPANAQTCPQCGELIEGRAVPMHVRDTRFPSGVVFRVLFVHPKCAEDKPEPRPAA